jgi:hypothetical protein
MNLEAFNVRRFARFLDLIVSPYEDVCICDLFLFRMGSQIP